MIKHFAAAICAILLLAADLPAKAETAALPAERDFPSTVGEVKFHHEMHFKDLAIKCVECHHSIAAKQLVTPHPDYLKSSSIKCEICHGKSGAARQDTYKCSGCHGTNPMNIADETLSAKVVIHQQCWKCHPVGKGKEASAGCKKCHAGKKTF
jgi:hypothetical protein